MPASPCQARAEFGATNASKPLGRARAQRAREPPPQTRTSSTSSVIVLSSKSTISCVGRPRSAATAAISASRFSVTMARTPRSCARRHSALRSVESTAARTPETKPEMDDRGVYHWLSVMAGRGMRARYVSTSRYLICYKYDFVRFLTSFSIRNFRSTRHTKRALSYTRACAARCAPGALCSEAEEQRASVAARRKSRSAARRKLQPRHKDTPPQSLAV